MTDTLRQTVALLFSGGDSPGMNAFQRAMVRLGLNRHERLVLGIRDGYQGLARAAAQIETGRFTPAQVMSSLRVFRAGCDITSDIVFFDQRSVSGILGRGGTVLGSARCPEFFDPQVRRATANLLKEMRVEALVVCGGDGSLAGAAALAAESSLQVLGIPASIDNDVPGTDACIGFDTAVNTIVDCAQKVGDTAASHHRVMVLETMGRGSGQLAQAAALAAGAEIVVTPERPPLDKAKTLGIAQRLENSLTQGRRHAIVLVAEGVKADGGGAEGPAQTLASFLQAYFKRGECPLAGVEVRLTVLGHIQRGGAPSAADRLLAARFAEVAWQAVMSPRSPSGVLGLAGRTIALHPFGSSADSQAAAHIQKMYDLQKDVSKY